MSRGYRGIILAAIGIALSFPSNSKETQPDQTQTSNAGTEQLGSIATAIEKLPPTPKPDRGCQPGQEDRQSDLCAQWKAADAAAESAKWSLWALWIGGIGLLIGGGTLFAAGYAAWFARKAAEHTEAAAFEARRAANAAEIALEDSRKAALVHLRPYIFFCDNPDAEKPRPFQRGDILPFRFRNFGQTPALNVRISFGWEIRQRPIGFADVEITMSPESYGHIAPGDERRDHIRIEDITPVDIALIASGGVFLLRSRLDYDIPGGGTDCHDVTMMLDSNKLRTSEMGLITNIERQRA